MGSGLRRDQSPTQEGGSKMEEPKKIRVELRRTEGGGLRYFFDCDRTPIPQELELIHTATIDMYKLRQGENPEDHVAELLMMALKAGVMIKQGRPDFMVNPVFPIS